MSKNDEKFIIKPITIPPKVWENGVKASEAMFGSKNFSGYVQSLVMADCKKRKIK